MKPLIPVLRDRSCGLRASTVDVFDRLGRYEMRLWRQTVQIVLLLNSVSRGASGYAEP